MTHEADDRLPLAAHFVAQFRELQLDGHGIRLQRLKSGVSHFERQFNLPSRLRLLGRGQ